ncbi:MAG: hypothetical protein HKN13_04745 [Rhodothermales bacterium]|nr:hypothetical protein [Rhodothermales bacterium]
MQTSTDTTPEDSMEAFAKNLQESPLLLVVYGDVSRDWVENRVVWALKQVVNKGFSTRVGVYVAEPAKSSDELDFHPFVDVVSGVGGLDASTIDALLEKAAG